MKLLDINKISLYPDDMLVEDIYNGIIVESTDMKDKKADVRALIYESIDNVTDSYYEINLGEICVHPNNTVIKVIIENGEAKLKECNISDIEVGDFLADSQIVSNFDEAKKNLVEIGMTSFEINEYKILENIDDEVIFPVPIKVVNIDLIKETTSTKYIEFQNKERSYEGGVFKNNIDVVFVDDIAVKIE